MRASRAGRITAAAAATAVAIVAWAAPVTAAKAPNPCKLLKASEISAEFDGATVSAPEPGLRTAASVECTWEVAAAGATPDGSVTARVMYIGAKAAYDGLKKTPDFVPVAGLKNSLWQDTTGALSVLDGSNLLTVQGVFLEGPPIQRVDVQEQLIPLLKLVQKRT